MTALKHLKIAEADGLCRIELHRPDRRNAFHPEMIAELATVFRAIDGRKDLLAIVFSGSGKSFSAGGDLDWMRSMVDYTHEENIHDARQLFDMFLAMSECSLPVVGVVHGHVMGGGLGLVSVCDWVLAEQGTQFSFSEARIGLAPAVITPFVKRKANWGRVLPLMVGAEIFDCDMAMNCGLVHFVGNSDQVQSQLAEVTSSLRMCAPGAVRDAKRLAWQMDRDQVLRFRDTCSEVIARRRASVEGQAGLKAFLQKRDPPWREKPS